MITAKGSLESYNSDIELKIPMEFAFNGSNYSVKEIKNSPEALKLSVIENSPVFRTRSAGDKFTLPKRKVTKSLKKLFNELGVPVPERESLPVICDSRGVIGVLGCIVDDRVKIDSNTVSVFILKIDTEDCINE